VDRSTEDDSGNDEGGVDSSMEDTDAYATEQDSALFVIPDTGWKYTQDLHNDDLPSVEEQEILSSIQQLQRKLMKVREEKKEVEEGTGVAGGDGGDVGKHSSSPQRDNTDSGAHSGEESDGDEIGRVLIVSNRLPIVFSKDPTTGRRAIKLASGGLVTALNGVRSSMQFVWIGWLGQEVTEEEKEELKAQMLEEYRCLPVFLPAEMSSQYYNGFCNNVLWPLFHYELLPSFRPGVEKKFERKLWKAYKDANSLFADAVSEFYEEGDVIWVHDYHLMMLPRFLRERGVTASVGWFLHVPFPSSDVYRILPVRNEILKGVLSADLVGFHTYDYARHFLSSCQRVLGLETSIQGVRLSYDHHFCSIGVHPIGIEPSHFQTIVERESTRNRIEELRERFKGVKVLLGVDRIDYIKGMPHKLLAFELFLYMNPDMRGKVVMLQIGVPSRTQMREYQKLTGQVNEIIGRINGTYGTLGYTPIHYVQRNISTEELCACYILADVCIITSLRDGMNLVSHEYILMQNERVRIAKLVGDEACQNPGVLLLSEFAGAIQSLSGAVRINPWNTEAVAGAIHTAITCDPALCRLRQEKLYQYVTTHTSTRWAGSFLEDMVRSSEVAKAYRLRNTPRKDVKLRSIVKGFKSSKRRLIVINYDDIFSFDNWDSQFLEPVQFVHSVLRSTCSDKRNTVVLISGRSRETLDSWFGGKYKITLCAEYGAYIKQQNATGREASAGADKWFALGRETEQVSNWQNAVMPIIKEFDDRTPGSFTERKEQSITWYYGDADHAFGAWQAKDLLSHLDELLGNYPVEIIPREKALEVRSLACGPPQVFQKIAEWEKAKKIARRQSFAPYDFLLVTVGNSKDDQTIINMLRAATSTVLPHQNAMPVENVVKSMFYGPDETTSYFCQACNKGLLTGDFMFEGNADVRKLFRNLGLPKEGKF
jgi:alpha,alpha-trehalose-phosphate synthase [UDP-forming]/trehalose-phosphatase